MIGKMCLWTAATLAVISAASVALYYVKSSFLKHAVTNYRKWVMERILETGIRENVTMFQEFPKEKVSDALEKAGLAELIRQKQFGEMSRGK